ncbi:MAG: hypothetical protein WCI21_01655 [Alphaproteobacteria bacterium]
MADIFSAHRNAFEQLRQGLCADAQRWTGAYPNDPRGPAFAMLNPERFGPWINTEEKATYADLLRAIGAPYAVVEEIRPGCILNVGYWSSPLPFSGGLVETKAWLYGDHWRRKALPVASDGKRPHDEGRPNGVDAIVFRAPLKGGWGIVTYSTHGADY